MSAASSGLLICLQMNALLVVGYIMFAIARWVLELSKIHVSHRSLTRVMRAVLVVSLIAPPLLAMIPSKHLPAVTLKIDRIFDEPEGASSFPLRKTSQDMREPLVNQNRRDSNESLWKTLWPSFQVLRAKGEAGAPWTALVICSVSSLLFLRLLFQLWSLLGVLKSAFIIRRFGNASVLASDEVSIPFSTLLGSTAYVVVPTNLLARSIDLKIAILHELEHHRQRDTLWAHITEILICLFPLNPFAYRWKHEAMELQEFACDETLVDRKRVNSYEYGSCLIRVAEAALGSRAMHVGTTCMAMTPRRDGRHNTFLKRRVRMISSSSRVAAKKGVGIALGTFIVTLVTGLALASQHGLRPSERAAANPGTPVYDKKIQAIAEDVLRAAVDKNDADGGFVLVADPETGKLLAAAAINKRLGDQLQGDWALQVDLNPASTFKPLIVAAALEAGATHGREVHDCEQGKYKYRGITYRDYAKFGHLNTAETLAGC